MILHALPLLALVVASPTRPASDTLFCIGHPDGHAREFALTRAGYAAFLERYPDGVAFDVDADPAKGWPFVHPADRDPWAGGTGHNLSDGLEATFCP